MNTHLALLLLVPDLLAPVTLWFGTDCFLLLSSSDSETDSLAGLDLNLLWSEESLSSLSEEESSLSEICFNYLLFVDLCVLLPLLFADFVVDILFTLGFNFLCLSSSEESSTLLSSSVSSPSDESSEELYKL